MGSTVKHYSGGYLGVETSTVDTTMPGRVEAIVWGKEIELEQNHGNIENIETRKLVCEGL